MILFESVLRHREVTAPDEVVDRVRWRRWVAGAVAAYLCIVRLAGSVNGEKTMASANT